ncbi:MAG TPA: patatin family protein, partial [Thermoanaerobaculia bacterium]|nr:patatin family protein [Thermoanaerobaculia bacterium]
DDYIALVQEVEEKFLAGVQTNIRTRIATVPAGLKMAFQPGYSRTSRAGDLYDEKLYCNIDQVSKRAMTDLLMRFPDQPDFRPKYDNWKRESKVPILVLNATTLNTGHNWQFTASWMGESPQAINGAIDAIPRLRRMYYDGDDIPGDYGRFPLGHAVGASACVPGLFEPIPLPKLYPDRTVRLVDGGVHDNQGLASLLEQSCNVVLISDASGQSREELNPKGSILGVTSRTNDLLQFRIRETQYDQLQALTRSGAIEGLMFIHLTSELDADAISWINAKDQDDIPQQRDPTTSYGVDRIVQKQLAEVRTDLDSFSDAEAYSLMMSGYLMAGDALKEKGCAPTLPLKEKQASWRFLAVEEAMTKPASAPNVRMRRLLRVSNKLPWKIWRLSPLPYVVTFALLVVIAGLAALVWSKVPPPTAAQVGWAAGGLVALMGATIVPAMIFAKKRFLEVVLGWFVATGLALASWLHVTIYDQMFLWYGSWEAKPKSSAFAAPDSPKLTIKATPPAAKPARRPVVRRVLNLFSPP